MAAHRFIFLLMHMHNGLARDSHVSWNNLCMAVITVFAASFRNVITLTRREGATVQLTAVCENLVHSLFFCSNDRSAGK